MDLTNSSAVVTGGASGLGLATVEALVARGVAVTIVDLPQSPGKDVASRLGDLVTFGPADVRDAAAVDAALDLAVGRAPLRTLVHCAGRGGTVRLVNRDGTPGDYDLYREIVDINLVGTFNVLRLAATRMSAQRAGRRRARRLRAHRVGRRVGGPDRPDPLRVGQGRRRRDDARGGAGPLAGADPGVLDRTRASSTRRSSAGSRTRSSRGWPPRCRTPRVSDSRRSSPRRRCTSSTTRCSTARRSGSTGRSGWRRGERSGQHPRRVGRPGRHHRAPRGAQRDQHGDRRGDRGGHGPARLRDRAGRRGHHRRRRDVLRRDGPQGVPRRRAPVDPRTRLRRGRRAAAGEAAHRGGRGVCLGRRVRDRARLRHGGRRRERAVRPAGGEARAGRRRWRADAAAAEGPARASPRSGP